MQYAVQITQRFETTERNGKHVQTTFQHTVLPCVSYADAKRLHSSFEGMEFHQVKVPGLDETEMYRSARIVVRVHNADNQKGVWLSLDDLEQIVSEYREEFNV